MKLYTCSEPQVKAKVVRPKAKGVEGLLVLLTLLFLSNLSSSQITVSATDIQLDTVYPEVPHVVDLVFENHYKSERMVRLKPYQQLKSSLPQEIVLLPKIPFRLKVPLLFNYRRVYETREFDELILYEYENDSCEQEEVEIHIRGTIKRPRIREEDNDLYLYYSSGGLLMHRSEQDSLFSEHDEELPVETTTCFYPNGKPYSFEQYINYEPSGYWKWYSPTGELTHQMYFLDEDLIGRDWLSKMDLPCETEFLKNWESITNHFYKDKKVGRNRLTFYPRKVVLDSFRMVLLNGMAMRMVKHSRKKLDWYLYYPNGQLARSFRTDLLLNMIPQELKFWHYNGQLACSIEQRGSGSPNGMTKEYDINGKLIYSYHEEEDVIVYESPGPGFGCTWEHNTFLEGQFFDLCRFLIVSNRRPVRAKF